MSPFRFNGIIPASKSLMNRALIVQSYFPKLKLKGSSQCDDVLHMQKSLHDLGKKNIFDCGEGGTTLRFMAFRISREKGEFFLKGSPRLLSRPQKDIQDTLRDLGVRVVSEKTGLRIFSEGWQPPIKPLKISGKDSSQFLSAVFLNAWNLDFDLKIQVPAKITSQAYFEMTLKMLKNLGLKWSQRSGVYTIPRRQKPNRKSYDVESDLSSLFSIAAFAAVSGKAQFKKFTLRSLQPDIAFLKVFRQMKVQVQTTDKSCVVTAGKSVQPVRVNLKDSPDLFPVLAVLCSFSEGTSVLYGAPQLVKKESDRIAKTAELLEKAGVLCEVRKDGMVIHGAGRDRPLSQFIFDPDKDHRLAFAAALLKYYGDKIKILDPQVVNKSFPEFWKYSGVRP